MSIRVDWQNIKSTIVSSGVPIGAPFVFVLPNAGRSLLMAIIDQLRYEATYRIEDYDFSDWDELQAIVEQTHYGLMDGELVGEISEAIVYLADTLAENMTGYPLPDGEDEMIQTVNVNCGGCGSCGGCGCSQTIGDSTNLPPDDYIPPVIEDTEPPNVVQNSVKCDRSNYLMVQYRTACLNVIQNLYDYGTFTDWWETVFGWMTVTVPGMYDMYLRLKEWLGGESVTDQFLTAYDQNFDALVCACYSASSASGAKTAVGEILNEFVMPNISAGYSSALMDIFGHLPFSVIFDDDLTIELPPGFDGRQCCGGDVVDLDLGVWEATGTGGYCEPGSVDVEWNQPLKVNGTVVLGRNQQYTSYVFDVSRQSSISDASYFSVDIEQAGDTHEWTIYFINGSGTVIHEHETLNQSDYSVAFTEIVFNFNEVDTVKIERNGEVYATACPREFTFKVEITTDSQEWLTF